MVSDPISSISFASRALVFLAAVLIAGCGSVGDLVGLGGGRSTPIADQRIELAGRCQQTDVDGFGEDAVLDVDNNKVTALRWQIRVGKRGTCTFDGNDFRQTKSRPHIELVSRDGSGCKLMIWQEPRRVTLGHTGCERWCSPRTIYDKAWPVMFDPRTGGCARLG
ncbi:MAG: hypothetical protein WCZ28_04615 [Burkholderiaceae bacterium]